MERGDPGGRRKVYLHIKMYNSFLIVISKEFHEFLNVFEFFGLR